MNESTPVQSTTEAKPSSHSTVQKWMAWASAIQIVLLLVIAVQLNGLGNATIQGAAVGLPDTGAPSGANAPSPTVDMKNLVDDDAVLGDKNAPITIVEFSDYECPFCARFHTQTFGELKSKYIDTGKVKFIYRDFPLSFHPQAQKAAEAAECAGEQDKYYDMHEKLFTDGVAGGVAGFKQYASQIGLNTAKFNECLDGGKMMSEIRKDTADGAAIGVQGTPAFYVNGVEVSGAQPFQVFQQIIDGQLAN